MDYSNYLVLYSGGADSTYFIQQEPTAKRLIHYPGLNQEQTKIAVINANILNKYITVDVTSLDRTFTRDGEANAIHALYDTQMALSAGIKALSFGMRGIVMCFNADDIGIDFEAVSRILKRVEPDFELLTPLIENSAEEVRLKLKSLSPDVGLKHVSCMYSIECGFCAKCRRGY